MATERQRRLYEAMQKQPYPTDETLAGRKEASDLGSKFFAAEHLSYYSNNSMRGDPLDQGMARRRRIYENEYKRPYPSNKRIHLLGANDYCAPPSVMTSSKTDPIVSPNNAGSQDGVEKLNSNDDEEWCNPHDEDVRASKKYCATTSSFVSLSEMTSVISPGDDGVDNATVNDEELSNNAHDEDMIANENYCATSSVSPLRATTSLISPDVASSLPASRVDDQDWIYHPDEELSTPHDEDVVAPEKYGASSSVSLLLKPTSVISPEIAPLPTSKVGNQAWIYNTSLSEDELSSPDDEVAENISPRMLWSTSSAWSGMDETTTGEGGERDFIELQETEFDVEIRIGTPQEPSALAIPGTDGEKSRKIVSFLSTASSTGSEAKEITNTPNRPILKAGESPSANVSMITTPDCMRAFFLPLAPVKGVSAQSSTAIVPHSMESKSGIDKRRGLRKARRDPESHRALQRFLKHADEEILKLYVDEYEVAVFDRIVECFYGNTSLKTVIISRREDEGEIESQQQRTPAEMGFLFEALRCLPNLKTIVVWNATVGILQSLVENLPRSLAKLCLQVVDGTIPNSILDALADKENLENVQLETQESMEIGRLINSSRISTLRVCGMWYDMDKHHMQGLAESLLANRDSPLMNLDIQPTMSLCSWKALAKALRVNTNLCTLKVSFMGTSLAERDAATAELAELIRSNTTLRYISNYTHDVVFISAEIGNELILEALRENKTLRKLHFFQEESVFWVAKHAVLTRNQEVFGEEGDLGHAVLERYVTFTSALPLLKARMCGEC